MLDVVRGIGFGVLLFLTHWVLSAHGVMARWIELDPLPFGAGLIAVMLVAFLVSHLESLTRSLFLSLPRPH